MSTKQDQSNCEDIKTSIEPAYISETEVITRTIYKYNPKYGDDRICKCGHSYYRHFDSYENMEPVGCKYCECMGFEEATNPHAARITEIQEQLSVYGLKMEPSLAAMAGEGHAIMDIASGDMAEDEQLTPEVIALAEEYSVLEGPIVGEEMEALAKKYLPTTP